MISDLFEAKMGVRRVPHTIAFGSMWGLALLAVFEGGWGQTHQLFRSSAAHRRCAAHTGFPTVTWC